MPLWQCVLPWFCRSSLQILRSSPLCGVLGSRMASVLVVPFCLAVDFYKVCHFGLPASLDRFWSSGLKDGFCPGSAVFPGCGFLESVPLWPARICADSAFVPGCAVLLGCGFLEICRLGFLESLPPWTAASVQILPSSLVLPFCLAMDFWKVCHLGLLRPCRQILLSSPRRARVGFCPSSAVFSWLWISGKSATLASSASAQIPPSSLVLPFCLAIDFWRVCYFGLLPLCLGRQGAPVGHTFQRDIARQNGRTAEPGMKAESAQMQQSKAADFPEIHSQAKRQNQG